jgi:hypothetical protein
MAPAEENEKTTSPQGVQPMFEEDDDENELQGKSGFQGIDGAYVWESTLAGASAVSQDTSVG